LQYLISYQSLNQTGTYKVNDLTRGIQALPLHRTPNQVHFAHQVAKVLDIRLVEVLPVKNGPRIETLHGVALLQLKHADKIENVFNLLEVEDVLVGLMELLGLHVQGFPVELLANTDFQTLRDLHEIPQPVGIRILRVGTPGML
jgi:hypothetical protein